MPVAWGQWPANSTVTNKPMPYSGTVTIPQVTIPQVIVPPTTSTEIPVAGAPLPPLTHPRTATSSPFRPNAAIPFPTTADMARGNVHIVAPPLPSQLPTATKPLQPDAAANKSAVTNENTRFVAPTGDDANDGSEEKPWQTIQHAAEWAQPGAVIVVGPGTYEPFHTVRGGTVSQPITFRAAGEAIIGPPGGQTPAEKKGTTPAELYRLNNIHIQQCDYIIMDGFQVQRAARCGIFVVESRGVVLRNNVISAARVFGILTGFAVEVQILSNKTFGTLEQHGIYVSNSRAEHDRPILRSNESYANAISGIQINGDCQMGGAGLITEALIENNSVHDNGSKGLSLISMSDSIVQNNLIYNNGKANGAGGIHLTDELGCQHPSRNNVIVNNTVIEPSIAGIRLTDGAADNIVFNNLLISPQPLVDEVGDNKIDKFSNVCLHSSAGIFVNPTIGDYHILATSPAKNQGIARYFQKITPPTDREGRHRNSLTGLNAGAY